MPLLPSSPTGDLPPRYPWQMTKTKHVSLDPETAGILSGSELGSDFVRLPGQLDRPSYDAVNKVITALGGKWSRKRGCHVFPFDPREAFGAALSTGQAVNRQQTYQAFYTPAAVARLVVEHARIERGHAVLEPSAGDGALADAVRTATGVSPICFEIEPVALGALRANGYEVEAMDFLTAPVSRVVDRVIMNPPFTAGQDIAHVARALAWLRMGGRLVAVTSPSWMFRGDRKSVAFRSRIASMPHHTLELPAGTFSESGTEVRTVVLVLDKAEG